jgi:hypothetical protein
LAPKVQHLDVGQNRKASYIKQSFLFVHLTRVFSIDPEIKRERPFLVEEDPYLNLKTITEQMVLLSSIKASNIACDRLKKFRISFAQLCVQIMLAIRGRWYQAKGKATPFFNRINKYPVVKQSQKVEERGPAGDTRGTLVHHWLTKGNQFITMQQTRHE